MNDKHLIELGERVIALLELEQLPPVCERNGYTPKYKTTYGNCSAKHIGASVAGIVEDVEKCTDEELEQ